MPQQEPRSLVALAFDSSLRSREALLAFQRLQAQQVVVIHDAVFIEKNEDGKAWVTETVDTPTGDSALTGGFWGAFLGTILAGPIGTLVGGAVSAGLGALTAKLIDIGIEDRKVKELEAALAPRSSALLLLLSQVDEDGLARELERFRGATLVQSNLSPETVQRLRDILAAKSS